MYALGIPHRQYRRATQVLGHERSSPIPYESVKQDDGFWLFTFPEADEYDFRDIVILLKGQGVSTIGADTQLTEKKIMKLTDLLKEQGSPDENNMIDILQRTLDSWNKPTYLGGIDYCERSNQYQIDLENIIDEFKNPLPGEDLEDTEQDTADVKADLDSMEEGSSTKNKLNERLQQLAGIKPLYEQDDLERLGSTMAKGFDDDFGDRFPGEDGAGMAPRYSPFAAKAKDYIEKFRQEYRDMSDEGMDEFSVEIINHLLDNTAAQAAAKVFFGKRGL